MTLLPIVTPIILSKDANIRNVSLDSKGSGGWVVAIQLEEVTRDHIMDPDSPLSAVIPELHGAIGPAQIFRNRGFK